MIPGFKDAKDFVRSKANGWLGMRHGFGKVRGGGAWKLRNIPKPHRQHWRNRVRFLKAMGRSINLVEKPNHHDRTRDSNNHVQVA